jgi:hypothetical protein
MTPESKERRLASARKWRERQRCIDIAAKERGLVVRQCIIDDGTPHSTGLTIHRFRMGPDGEGIVAHCIPRGWPYRHHDIRPIPITSIGTKDKPAIGPLPHFTARQDY